MLLYGVVISGYVCIVEIFLDVGVDFSFRIYDGDFVMDVVVKGGYVIVVELLMDYFVKVEER